MKSNSKKSFARKTFGANLIGIMSNININVNQAIISLPSAFYPTFLGSDAK
ncbi:MAG: hypothetical protein VSS75_028140 [Candidatus Parabeggiatoa sp.]|nr:hypothetical protein [Candidatus Parabeggiatoa sp.]